MFKRTIVLLAAVAILAVAGAAGAAVSNTAHDTPIGDQGVCSACHIPHKSVGTRLWPAQLITAANIFGEVGQLCFYCHGAGGGAGLPNAVQLQVLDTSLTQNAYSHGLISTNIPAGGNGLAASGLPYVDQALIQCTSCHNVHDDTARPFMQQDLDVICALCHTERMYVDGALYVPAIPATALGAWQTAATNRYGLANAGAHPVGTDVADDTDGDDSPITIDGGMQVAKAALSGDWALGGHLSTTGSGVTCTTCHAVHGSRADEDPPTAGTLNPANMALLVFDQEATDTNMADSDGLARNLLCESCHVDNAAVTTWDPSGAGAAYAGGNEPNPGFTAYTHPVDDLGAQYDAGVTVFGVNAATATNANGSWPEGSTPGTNVLPGPICESCHTPHPAANDALAVGSYGRGEADYIVGTGDLRTILRDTNETVCADCHSGAIGSHHPVGAYDTTRFSTAAGAVIGDNLSPLTCGDCHNGNGAHNWVASAMTGLDADWVPTNNGRTATDSRAGETNALASATCVDCHTGPGTGTGAAADHPSPTSHDGSIAGAPLSGRTRSTDYQDNGEGSHYLGITVAVDYTTGYLNGATWDATSDNWTGNTNTNSGWTRFDTTNAQHIVCESCHDLEPDKNSGTAYPMLLGEYQEGANLDPSDFCEACHSQTPGGANPHPMTSDVISRAQLAGITPTTLITTGRYTQASAGWTVNATMPNGDNTLNCDSCHQPHDAATNGGTYIYDAPAANVAGTPDDTTWPDGHPPLGSNTTGLEDVYFCNQCHSY